MSWQAQTAVARHSQQTKLAPYKLLHLLAERADSKGLVDPAPSQATWAIELGCTDRMIRNYLDALIDSGELEQTRVGGGPGRPSAYQITLTMPTEGEQPAGEKVEKTADNLSARVESLEAKVEIISQNLSIITRKVEEMVEIMAAMVEKVEAKGGNETVELVADDPVLEPEEIQSKNTPLTPQGEAGGEKPKRNGRGKTEVAYEIPAVLDTPEFRASWAEYGLHRQQLGKKLTSLAATKQLVELEKMGLQRALVAIPYSIAHGWIAIYEPRLGANGVANGRQPQPAEPKSFAAIRAALGDSP